MEPLIHLAHITKKFGEFTALTEVDFQVKQGVIHALVGENGAGKTTLMRILYGSIQSDQGHIYLNGQEKHFHSAADAIQSHIGMVSQHYSIIPELTCLENLVLGAVPSPFIQRGQLIQHAQHLSEKMNFHFDWKVQAGTLSPSGAQKLEILKLLWRNAKIMILDEPTAMLSPLDSDALYGSLRKLTEEGATVIVVTHRIPEVLNYCDTVTVLRGGKKITDRPVTQIEGVELAELIIGHSVQPVVHTSAHIGEAKLKIKNLKALGDQGESALKGINLTLNAGEMLGIAGVDGNGQKELFQALIGTLRPSEGTIEFGGMSVEHFKPAQRIALGFRFIPEDRHAEGVIEEWSLTENAALGFQQLKPLKKGPWMSQTECQKLACQIAGRFHTKYSNLETSVAHLSGGNQQRFVSARALEFEPKLLLAFQPSRGLDIEGTQQVYQAIKEACERGAAAIVVSFDLDELIQECDRVVAMNHGHLYEPPEDLKKDRMSIGKLMVGMV